MLPTDWARPSGMVQARISDSRVIQFWDKDHLVAKELQQQLSSSQICCRRNGIIWDVAALYPTGVQWGTSAPVFFGGAVLDVAGDIRQHLSAISPSR
jgi:glycine/serine hydroxymethyltransferase